MVKDSLERVISHDMSDLWTALDADEKRLITDNFKLHTFKKNQVVYGEGEEPESLWCLLKGQVKKVKDGVGGRVQILRLIRPVQYFGYRAWFAGERYVSSAMTLEPSTIGSLPMELVERLIHNNTRVAMFFIHDLSRNLGTSDARIVSLTQKHIRGRLAETLTVLIDNYGYEDDGTTMAIYMAREDLANLSNMTTSNAIRTLSGFVDEQLIVVDGRRIKVIDEAAIRKISRFG